MYQISNRKGSKYMDKEPKYCPYCGTELTKHKVECKVEECGLNKTWQQDCYHCPSCNDEFWNE